MKRVCNDNKFKPKEVEKRKIEIYSNRRDMSENYESYTKSAKFYMNGIKKM